MQSTDAGARLSACGTYRYDLWRTWGGELPLAFVMLNPSTADATDDDPTLGRCIAFARTNGFGGVILRNLFAFRTPSPRVLNFAIASGGHDVVGPENDDWLQRLGEDDPVGGIVAAWGKGTAVRRRRFEERVGTVVWLLGASNLRALHPRPYRGPAPHPLYLRANTPLGPYPAVDRG